MSLQHAASLAISFSDAHTTQNEENKVNRPICYSLSWRSFRPSCSAGLPICRQPRSLKARLRTCGTRALTTPECRCPTAPLAIRTIRSFRFLAPRAAARCLARRRPTTRSTPVVVGSITPQTPRSRTGSARGLALMAPLAASRPIHWWKLRLPNDIQPCRRRPRLHYRTMVGGQPRL